MSLSSDRAVGAKAIEDAYSLIEKSLSRVGKLLRTTHAGRYLWAADHKAAVSGLKVIVKHLRNDVPNYGQGNQ